MRRQPLGLQKDLVAILIRKTVNFVFNTRTITRPDTLDLPSKHGTAIKTTADNIVGF